MGIGSWFVILILMGVSITFVYTIFRTSEKVLTIQAQLQKTGEQKPFVPLITTGIIGLFGIVMTFVYYLPHDSISSIIQTFIYYFGILLYISAFTAMFFVGRSYSRPGFPKKAMSPAGVIAGLSAAFLPFLLLLVLGKFVASGGMTRETLMEPLRGSGSLAEFLLIITLLILPSISGIFGAGVFGKLSLQN